MDSDMLAIAQQIKALEESLANRDRDIKVSHALLDVARVNRVSAYDAVKQARIKFEAAERELQERNAALDKLRSAKKNDSNTLKLLKDKFELMQDQATLKNSYLENYQAFQTSAAKGTWLAVNREDGRGAFQYQIDGAIHAAVAKRAILGDKRGLGKSLTSLIWLDLLKISRAVIVCPADTMDNYIREIRMWSPHRKCIRVGSIPKAIQDVFFMALEGVESWTIVVNYEAWRKNMALIDKIASFKPQAIIADEAHMVKDPESIGFRGLMSLRAGGSTGNYCECGNPDVKWNPSYNRGDCQSCGRQAGYDGFTTVEYVLPMTGTPILNKPQELFPLCRLIYPERFPSLNRYLNAYCEKVGTRWHWKPGAHKKLVELLGTSFLARTREDVGIDIPPPTEIIHRYSMDDLKADYPKQYEAYQQVRKYGQLMLDPDREIAMKMTIYLTVLLRLRQVLTDPSGIELKVHDKDEEGSTYVKEIIPLNVNESIKMDKTEQLVRELIEEGDRVIVFSQFRDVLFKMKERFGDRACVYAGGMSRSAKQDIQLDFDPKTAPKDYKYDVVFALYKSGGTGLNLQAANHVVRMDREWNPGKEDQADGRADRIGQEKPVYIHTMHIEGGSVDGWMASLIDEKSSIIQQFKSEADAAAAVFNALKEGKM